MVCMVSQNVNMDTYTHKLTNYLHTTCTTHRHTCTRVPIRKGGIVWHRAALYPRSFMYSLPTSDPKKIAARAHVMPVCMGMGV